MIAQIKYDDKEFYSYIFFLCIYEYRTKAIVFNDLENKFELSLWEKKSGFCCSFLVIYSNKLELKSRYISILLKSKKQ